MTKLAGFRVYTHNIRYDNRNPVHGEPLWEDRRSLVVASIHFHAKSNSFVCLQEVLHHQLLDILDALGSGWTYVGVGRDDGKTSGEYAPILYRTDEWQLKDSKNTWLSPTPDVPSRGWDAALPRIVTWASFVNLHSGVKANMFNTHFDHQGVEARKNSAKLIVDVIPKYAGENTPAVLCGDFNSTDDDGAYAVVSGSLKDSARVVPDSDRYGHTLTYTGFNDREQPTRIDYVWTTQNVTAKTYAVLHSRFHNLTFSDHRPVVVDVQFKP